MAIKFNCACGKKIEAPDQAAGRKGKCPKCGREVVVPAPGRVQREVRTEAMPRRGGPPVAPSVPCRKCGKQVPASSFDCPYCKAPVELGSDLSPAPKGAGKAPPPPRAVPAAARRSVPAAKPAPLPPPPPMAEEDLNATVVDDVFAAARPPAPQEVDQLAVTQPSVPQAVDSFGPTRQAPARPDARSPAKAAPPPQKAPLPAPPRSPTAPPAPAREQVHAPAPASLLPRSFPAYMSFLVGAGGCLLQLGTVVFLWFLFSGRVPELQGLDLRRCDLHKAALATLVAAPMALLLGLAGHLSTRDDEARAIGRSYADVGITYSLLSLALGALMWFFPPVFKALPDALK